MTSNYRVNCTLYWAYWEIGSSLNWTQYLNESLNQCYLLNDYQTFLYKCLCLFVMVFGWVTFYCDWLLLGLTFPSVWIWLFLFIFILVLPEGVLSPYPVDTWSSLLYKPLVQHWSVLQAESDVLQPELRTAGKRMAWCKTTISLVYHSVLQNA